MGLFISFLVSIIFFALSGIHFYWAIGGKWGFDSAIPTDLNDKKMIQPNVMACIVVGIGLLGLGFFMLIKAQILNFLLPNWLSNYGLWIISLLFMIRAMGDFNYVGFFKKIKSTKFGQMDSKYYSPLCLLIGIACAYLAGLK